MSASTPRILHLGSSRQQLASAWHENSSSPRSPRSIGSLQLTCPSQTVDEADLLVDCHRRVFARFLARPSTKQVCSSPTANGHIALPWPQEVLHAYSSWPINTIKLISPDPNSSRLHHLYPRYYSITRVDHPHHFITRASAGRSTAPISTPRTSAAKRSTHQSGTSSSPSNLQPQAIKCPFTLSLNTPSASSLIHLLGQVELAWPKGRDLTRFQIFTTSFGRIGT